MLPIRNLMPSVIALAAVLSTNPAFSQSKGPNGGMVAGKEGHETELIVSPSELTVYLIDKGKVESAKGSVVRAVVQEGGNNSTLLFAVVEGNKLVAKLPAPLVKGAIVVVTGKDDHGHPLAARYVID